MKSSWSNDWKVLSDLDRSLIDALHIIIKCGNWPNCKDSPKERIVTIEYGEFTSKGNKRCCTPRCSKIHIQTGKKRSPEIGEAIGAALLKRYKEDPTLGLELSKSLIEAHKLHPEYGEAQSKRIRKAYAENPEYGKAVSKGLKKQYKDLTPFKLSNIKDTKTWICKNKDGSKFTKADFIIELANQNSICAFPDCGINQFEINRAFAADHDHETGVFRALLCNSCNQHKVCNHTKKSAENLLIYFNKLK